MLTSNGWLDVRQITARTLDQIQGCGPTRLVARRDGLRRLWWCREVPVRVVRRAISIPHSHEMRRIVLAVAIASSRKALS